MIFPITLFRNNRSNILQINFPPLFPTKVLYQTNDETKDFLENKNLIQLLI